MRSAIQDEWSPLSFIAALGGEDGTKPPGAAQYFDLSDQRRMRAYAILNAFMTNTRREYLGQVGVGRVDRSGRPIESTAEAREYREYGDAALLVQAARALILGDEQTVILSNPDDDEPLDAATSPLAEWVEGWLAREQFTQRLLSGETHTIGLGDAVYVLGTSDRAGRPKLRVEDPGFYFPDFDAQVEGWDDDGFPAVVHLCWEYESAADRKTHTRRVTWRMAPLEEAVASPWSDQPRRWTCWYSVEDMLTGDISSKASVYSERMARNVEQVVEPTDLRIDFIPVVHVPNTPGVWGTSLLTMLAQLLDDIQSNDSDIATASQTANPLLVTDAEALPALTGLPGESVRLNPGADARYISASLAGLMEHGDRLARRLAQNSRLGEVLLGRVAPNDVPSGLALNLGFHPARQLMRDARTIRDEKFPLIVKFALRLAQAWGWCPPGPTPDIQVALGNSLPSDLPSVVENVKDLLAARAISVDSAVRMLQSAGLPLDDAAAEVARIQADDTEALVRLVDALGVRGTEIVLQRLAAADATRTAQPDADKTGQE